MYSLALIANIRLGINVYKCQTYKLITLERRLGSEKFYNVIRGILLRTTIFIGDGHCDRATTNTKGYAVCRNGEDEK